MTTYPQLLDRWLVGSPGRPLLTSYDRDGGSRTELSVATYANWVAKAASLLVDELDLERGDRLLLDVPTHWLGPVLLGAAWSAGLEVGWRGEARAVVCGPGTLHLWAAQAASLVVVATALDPWGRRFEAGVPAGVRDLGAEIWSQPDTFLPADPPTDPDPALPGLTQGELWARAAAGPLLADGGRLLTTRNPASEEGWTAFAQAFARGGSLVLASGSESDLDQVAADERATSRWD